MQHGNKAEDEGLQRAGLNPARQSTFAFFSVGNFACPFVLVLLDLPIFATSAHNVNHCAGRANQAPLVQSIQEFRQRQNRLEGRNEKLAKDLGILSRKIDNEESKKMKEIERILASMVILSFIFRDQSVISDIEMCCLS